MVSRETRTFLTAVATYILVGFLSAGWVDNHTPPCDPLIKEYCSRYSHSSEVFGAGFLWPVYWGFRAAQQVTRWP